MKGRASSDFAACRLSEGRFLAHRTLILTFFLRQRLHELAEGLNISFRKGYFQGMGKGAFQPFFPAGAAVMQVGAPPGEFAGQVHAYAVRVTHNAHQRTLGQHGSAAHAGTLGNMLRSFGLFAGHLLTR